MSGRAVIVTVLAGGVAASMTLGMFNPFLAGLGAEFGLSFAVTAGLASAVTLIAALVCLPLGLWADRRRLRTLFAASSVVLAALNAGSAVAGHAGVLFALRAGQGVSFAIVVVAGPALLTRLLEGGQRQVGLALWGMCVPVGLGLASAAGGVLAGAGWRAGAVPAAVVALGAGCLVFWVLPADVPAGADGDGRRRGGAAGADADERRSGGAAWARIAVRAGLLAVGFAAIALVGVAVVTVLPVYLSAGFELPAGVAALVSGPVAASSALGSLLCGAALQRRWRARRLVGAALIMAVAGAGLFLAAPLALPLAIAVACAVAVMVLNGVAVSALFALLPEVAGQRLAGATGALTQAGSLGTLLGPPLYAAVAQSGGWVATVPVTMLLAGGGVACAVLASGVREIRHGIRR